VLRARLHRFAYLMARCDFAAIALPDRASLADILKVVPAGREPEILAENHNGLAQKVPKSESIA
jgi:hypothetical protein